MRPFHLDALEGFDPLVGRFVAMLRDTRRRLLRDLDGITPGELDATPGWAHNSVGTLLYHVAAIELDWTYADLLEGADGFPDGTTEWFPVDVRERDGRLSPVVEPIDRHLARLAWVREHLEGVLVRMSDADLEQTISNEGDESGRSWVLHHLMQHEAEHRGQIGEIRAALRA